MEKKDYKNILCETTEDGIVTITLNRPKVNLFNREMGRELIDALHKFYFSETERVLILTGAGSAFCAGEDLKEIDFAASPIEQADRTRKALYQYHNIVHAILASKKPIFAALNGVAAGAGLSIALACDERFGFKNIKADLVPGFASIGLTPDAGMAALLERLVGYHESKKWLRPGFSLAIDDPGSQKVIRSCTNLSEDPRDLLDWVQDQARKLMQSLSLAEFGATKAIQNVGLIHHLLNNVFPMELDLQVKLELGPDFREGLTAFREKRKPKFNQGSG